MNRLIGNPNFVPAEQLLRGILFFYEHQANNGETEGSVEETRNIVTD